MPWNASHLPHHFTTRSTTSLSLPYLIEFTTIIVVYFHTNYSIIRNMKTLKASNMHTRIIGVITEIRPDTMVRVECRELPGDQTLPQHLRVHWLRLKDWGARRDVAVGDRVTLHYVQTGQSGLWLPTQFS